MLAIEPVPLSWRPSRVAAASYGRVRDQARVRVEGRSKGEPVFETLEVEDGVGLSICRRLRPAMSSSTSREIHSSARAVLSTCSATSLRTIPASSISRECGD